MKKIVIISDLHCGSIYGLTPPEWQSVSHKHDEQKFSWDEYMRIANKWYAPDILYIGGDCIDGKQTKSGGSELITSDRNAQCDMAVVAINKWHAKKILMTYGTAYHSGQEEDFEWQIAERLGAKIEGHLFFECGGVTFDCRHKVGRSIVPYGRASAVLRDIMWNMLSYVTNDEPLANVIIRSHVHYHIWVEQPNRVAFTTPALQLSGGRYGSRECVGETHWGAIRLTVDDGKIIGKDIDICKIRSNKPKLYRVR